MAEGFQPKLHRAESIVIQAPKFTESKVSWWIGLDRAAFNAELQNRQHAMRLTRAGHAYTLHGLATFDRIGG